MVVADLSRDPDQETSGAGSEQRRGRPCQSILSITSVGARYPLPEKANRGSERQPAGVERGRIEPGTKFVHRPGDVLVEHVLDDAHGTVVVERQVDVFV